MNPKTSDDSSPRIPKMCRHKGSGRAVVRLDGRDHYLGRWGTRQARTRYRQVIGEWLAALDGDSDPPETIGVLASLYWRHVRRRYRKAGRLTSEAEAARQAQRRRRRNCKVYPRQERQRARGRPRKPKRRPGPRYTKDSYRVAVRRACLKAGVKPWTPHQLRHARITELGQEYSLDTARAVAGHKSVNTTLIYTARDLDLAIEVARRIG